MAARFQISDQCNSEQKALFEAINRGLDEIGISADEFDQIFRAQLMNQCIVVANSAKTSLIKEITKYKRFSDVKFATDGKNDPEYAKRMLKHHQEFSSFLGEDGVMKIDSFRVKDQIQLSRLLEMIQEGGVNKIASDIASFFNSELGVSAQRRFEDMEAPASGQSRAIYYDFRKAAYRSLPNIGGTFNFLQQFADGKALVTDGSAHMVFPLPNRKFPTAKFHTASASYYIAYALTRAFQAAMEDKGTPIAEADERLRPVLRAIIIHAQSLKGGNVEDLQDHFAEEDRRRQRPQDDQEAATRKALEAETQRLEREQQRKREEEKRKTVEELKQAQEMLEFKKFTPVGTAMSIIARGNSSNPGHKDTIDREINSLTEKLNMNFPPHAALAAALFTDEGSRIIKNLEEMSKQHPHFSCDEQSRNKAANQIRQFLEFTPDDSPLHVINRDRHAQLVKHLAEHTPMLMVAALGTEQQLRTVQEAQVGKLKNQYKIALFPTRGKPLSDGDKKGLIGVRYKMAAEVLEKAGFEVPEYFVEHAKESKFPEMPKKASIPPQLPKAKPAPPASNSPRTVPPTTVKSEPAPAMDNSPAIVLGAVAAGLATETAPEAKLPIFTETAHPPESPASDKLNPPPKWRPITLGDLPKPPVPIPPRPINDRAWEKILDKVKDFVNNNRAKNEHLPKPMFTCRWEEKEGGGYKIVLSLFYQNGGNQKFAKSIDLKDVDKNTAVRLNADILNTVLRWPSVMPYERAARTSACDRNAPLPRCIPQEDADRPIFKHSGVWALMLNFDGQKIIMPLGLNMEDVKRDEAFKRREHMLKYIRECIANDRIITQNSLRDELQGHVEAQGGKWESVTRMDLRNGDEDPKNWFNFPSEDNPSYFKIGKPKLIGTPNPYWSIPIEFYALTPTSAPDKPDPIGGIDINTYIANVEGLSNIIEEIKNNLPDRFKKYLESHPGAQWQLEEVNTPSVAKEHRYRLPDDKKMVLGDKIGRSDLKKFEAEFLYSGKFSLDKSRATYDDKGTAHFTLQLIRDDGSDFFHDEKKPVKWECSIPAQKSRSQTGKKIKEIREQLEGFILESLEKEFQSKPTYDARKVTKIANDALFKMINGDENEEKCKAFKERFGALAMNVEPIKLQGPPNGNHGKNGGNGEHRTPLDPKQFRPDRDNFDPSRPSEGFSERVRRGRHPHREL